jgi:hypothetical protein
MGLIPSGTYRVVGQQVLFEANSDADRDLLERALNLVQEAARDNLPFESFQRLANERAPELSALWQLMPHNQQEACQFWLMVFAAITVFLLAYQTFHPTPTQILLPEKIVDASIPEPTTIVLFFVGGIFVLACCGGRPSARQMAS